MPLRNSSVVEITSKTFTVWVLGDHRLTKKEIIQSLVNGSCSLYEYKDAAKRDAFQTEKVWKLNITATEV